ncbi:hypothetical protein [Halomonas sp. 707B3]|uniref:hypothetical protein n=1 Tax=Halomonas sp. 707B3 TaxID=1681043 RepID=UPI00209E1616|nr:hypothetical protein [Halomonas sp. 707B3]MCP1318591.1 hypothetical protein [Halomonas sp. 707B3]
MLLIKLNDQGGIGRYPYTLRMLKNDHPNVSLPSNPDDATLLALGAVRMQTIPRPTGDVVTEGTPEQQPDGTWRQTWVVRDFKPEETAEALAKSQERKRQEINRAYEDELNVILKNYPEVETKTWDKQEQEARAWAADNTAVTPLLTEIANARGLTMAELVPRVIAKADAWMQLSGAATGKRQALEEQIESATTVEEVEAIQW